MIKFNNIPDIKNETSLLDYQGELVFLMEYLLEKGLATKVGTYNSDDGAIPLFKHHERGKFDVESITNRTGEKLLDGVKLKQIAKLNTLASWLISKFPIIKKNAEAHYEQSLDSERHQAQIITGAAHYLYKQKNKRVKPENIIWGFSSVALVLLSVYLYANYKSILFNGMSLGLILAAGLLLVSMLILKITAKIKPYLFGFGLVTFILTALLAIYQQILLSFEGDGRLAASVVIFPVIMLLVFNSIYLFFFTLSYSKIINKKSFSYVIYKGIKKFRPNFFRLYEMLPIFIASSVGILVMANITIFWESLSQIIK